MNFEVAEVEGGVLEEVVELLVLELGGEHATVTSWCRPTWCRPTWDSVIMSPLWNKWLPLLSSSEFCWDFDGYYHCEFWRISNVWLEVLPFKEMSLPYNQKSKNRQKKAKNQPHFAITSHYIPHPIPLRK